MKHIINYSCFTGVDLELDPVLNRYSSPEDKIKYIETAYVSLLNSSSSTLEPSKLISFTSDKWDLCSIFDNDKNSQCQFIYFHRFPNDIKIKFKYYIIYIKQKGTCKASTLYIRFSQFSSIIASILDKKKIDTLDGICTSDIIDEIDLRDYKAFSKHSAYLAIYQFYHYLITYCHYDYPVDLDQLSEEEKAATDTSKKQNNKLPNIPREYAHAIEESAVVVMRNDEAEYCYRLIACSLLLLMKLGVRIGDLLDFRINNLKTTKSDKFGFDYYSITYYIQKLSRANSVDYGHEIYSPKLCTEAFQTMLKIRLSQPGAIKSDFLFCIGDQERINKPKYKRLYHDYMVQNHYALCSDNRWSDCFKGVSRQGKTIYIPETRQYRVFVCNDLIAKGVSMSFIEEHLKHLSDAMMGYYARPEDRTAEYVEYAENILKTIVIDNIPPIGLQGEEIKRNIDTFIKSNKINVEKDYSAIYRALKDKVAIRAKTGGFCFKTSLVPCSQDFGTDKMMCAFNLCPNVYSFYYMIDISYSEFQGHIEAYEQNLMKGLSNGADKELATAKSLIHRKLQPQLMQLEKEIENKGARSVIDEHPNIIDIVNMIPEIKKELNEWKKKK